MIPRMRVSNHTIDTDPACSDLGIGHVTAGNHSLWIEHVAEFYGSQGNFQGFHFVVLHNFLDDFCLFHGD